MEGEAVPEAGEAVPLEGEETEGACGRGLEAADPPTNGVFVAVDEAGVVGTEEAEGEEVEALDSGEVEAAAAAELLLQEEVEGEEGVATGDEEAAVEGTDGAAREAVVADDGL